MLKSRQQTLLVMITNTKVTTPSATIMCQLKKKKEPTSWHNKRRRKQNRIQKMRKELPNFFEKIRNKHSQKSLAHKSQHWVKKQGVKQRKINLTSQNIIQKMKKKTP